MSLRKTSLPESRAVTGKEPTAAPLASVGLSLGGIRKPQILGTAEARLVSGNQLHPGRVRAIGQYMGGRGNLRRCALRADREAGQSTLGSGHLS